MINQVTLVGHLGDEPVSRYMPSGDAVTNISVATSERYKDKQSGEQKEVTEWHKVAAFGKLAEIMVAYLHKGSQVYIQGKLRTRKWEKDGQNHYTTEIICQTMKMLGPKPAGAGGTGTGRGQLPEEKRPEAKPIGDAPGPGPDDFDDDIPF